MSKAACTLTMLVGPSDREFLHLSLTHIVRMSNYEFESIIVVADDLPNKNPDTRTTTEFLNSLDELKAGISRLTVLQLSTFRKSEELSRKYFGAERLPDRDHRGIPLFGWIAGLEKSSTDFVVHFDSDVLMYQRPDSDWIAKGIDLIQTRPGAMFISPLPGPPTQTGRLEAQTETPGCDEDGNFVFSTFSSRRFLVSKQKLNALLPTPVLYTSPTRAILGKIGIGNAILPWESCMSGALRRSQFVRVHLKDGAAWTLHCPNHNAEWRKALPSLIARIEKGEFPPAQAGYYDLNLANWTACSTG